MSGPSRDAPADGPAHGGTTHAVTSDAEPRRPGLRRPGRRLTRRARTVWIGGLISAALIAVAVSIPVPFVALGPGSTFNTIAYGQGDKVITFSGQDVPDIASQQPSGHLNMLTIRVVDQIPLLEAASMWVSGTYEFAPRDEFYPPDKSKQEVIQENVQIFRESQSTAEIEALRYLDYPDVVYIASVVEGSPSRGLLQPNDRIIAIDDHQVTDYESLKKAMATTEPGQRVKVTVLRDGAELARSVTLEANSSAGSQGFLGVGVFERPLAPFTIHISLEDIGGPSAGLMFTLGIIDRLTPGDLTGGRFIAGTGTVGLDGAVGPIGGVTLKTAAARSAGAEFMLVPEENCAEALTDVPDGLTLVRVSTLDDAIDAVHAIANDERPTRCADSG